MKRQTILLPVSLLLTAVFLFTGCSAEKRHDASTDDNHSISAVSIPNDMSVEEHSFISSYRNVSLTLNEGWSVTQDQVSLCSFQSERGDTLDISYTEGTARIAVLTFPQNSAEATTFAAENGYPREESTIRSFSARTFGEDTPVSFFEFLASTETAEGQLYCTGVKTDQQAYILAFHLTDQSETALNEAKAMLETLQFLESEELTNALRSGILHETEALTSTSLQPGELPGEGRAVCSSPVNVRTAPRVSGSQVIGALDAGESIEILGEEGNWYQFDYQGQTAYVCKDYFE